MLFISCLCPLCPPTKTISLSTLSPFQMTDTAVLFSSPGNLPNNPFQDTREKVGFIAFLFGCLIFLPMSVKSYTLFYTVVYNSSLLPSISALVPYHIYHLSFKTERSTPDHQACPSCTWYIFSKDLMFCPHCLESLKIALQKHSQRYLFFSPQISSYYSFSVVKMSPAPCCTYLLWNISLFFCASCSGLICYFIT